MSWVVGLVELTTVPMPSGPRRGRLGDLSTAPETSRHVQIFTYLTTYFVVVIIIIIMSVFHGIFCPLVFRRNKRDRLEILPQCTEWSQFAFRNFFGNKSHLYGQKIQPSKISSRHFVCDSHWAASQQSVLLCQV